jgi:spindle assembly abnormal protein 6
MSTELYRDEPLFESVVPVRIFETDRDERLVNLTVRVLRGVKVSTTHRENLLHIEVTDDNDSFFLYTLDVSEEDFHFLKADQNLLVEFPNFAPKFIELLQHCVERSMAPASPAAPASPSAAPLRFAAALDARASGKATFDLIEANKFKNLTHLSLKLVKGTDQAIKGYLASRQELFKTRNAALAESLGETSGALETERAARARLEARVAELEAALERSAEASETAKSHMRAKAENDTQSVVNKQREEHMRIVAELQARHVEETAGLQSRLDTMLVDMPTIVAERATLKQRNQELENSESQRLRLIETGRQDIEGLRKMNREIDSSRFQLEKDVQKQQVQMSALRQQLEDKEELLEQMSRRLEAAGTQRVSLEESLAMYKNNLDRLEVKFQASVGEINKGNDIIQRIHAEQRQLRSKVKVKGVIMAKQEEHLAEKEREIDISRAKGRELESGLSRANDRIARIEGELARKSASLAEANKLLKSNQQVINWLNKEINELQMQGTRSLGPSAAKFDLGEFGKASDYLSKSSYNSRNNSTGANVDPSAMVLPASQEERNADARLIAKLKSVAAPTEPLAELIEAGGPTPLHLRVTAAEKPFTP